MTSAVFRTFPISSIVVDRDTRQRKELRGIDELAESIARIGLINPIVITDDGVLVAGERRLTACTSLGWDHISVQLTSDLDDYTLQSIELEENIKRMDLTWQEEVDALARFHELKKANEESWSHQDTADSLGYSQPEVSKKLAVAAQLSDPVIAKAERFSAAHNIVQRNTERKKSNAVEAFSANTKTMLAEATGESPTTEAKAPPLLLTSFHDWRQTYDGPKFNLIHCDFPYGINVADAPRMSSTIKDHYEDSPDIYWALLARLALAMDNVVAESAHLIFWHSMRYHSDTKMELERMGWTVQPFPLIWHKSDNSGIAPDPQRGPRQTYAAAIFAYRGDRKITAAGCVANSFAYPGSRDGAIHVSEKPYAMLRHFLRMVCDEYSFVLDPTCGSANALKVAEDLGAPRVLGLEQMEEFYKIACDNWEGQRSIT